MNKATIFMAASLVGLAGLGLAVAGSAFVDAPRLVQLGTVLLIAGSFAMLATRRADEFVESLWNAGASVAFGVLLVSLFGLSFAEGFIDGVMGNEAQRDLPPSVAPMFAIGGFYIGLFVKRLLGDG